MASWMVHLRIADGLLDDFGVRNTEQFVVGNIAPDCGEMDSEGNYIPEKYITHWQKSKSNDETRADEFYEKYIARGTNDQSFYLGYYCHLITDILWKKNIFLPVRERFADKFEKDKNFIWEIKADWYGLDHLFLTEHPDFRAFGILESVKSFPNRYLDYYSENAIEKQIRYITAFYKNYSWDSDRDYIYLNKNQWDAFAAQAVLKIKRIADKRRMLCETETKAR